MRIRILAFVIIISLIIASCSSPTPPTETPPKVVEPTAVVALPTEAPTSTPIPTEVPTEIPTKAIKTIDEAKSATIQIEAQGSFVDPEFGQQLNSAGRGSGFIIDPSGIAVTNNHVVTGSALIKVWVGGSTKPLNAKVLGVSECWDLAVIDIEGDDFPFFNWYTGKTDPGVEVYSAGFPLGDPEYTLTKGIISKANANGETNWASVDAVIEHDARIRAGNSGGPLLSTEGKVVGINYAGSNQYDTNYAINSAIALPVIEKLRSGVDFESIGVNGSAIASEDGSTTGIWVASVKSGSPADKSGIEGGDIITKLEGLVLATDGTMSSYCDILRTRSATDTYSVEILRYASQEVLEGQINGRALEQSFSFAEQISEDTSSTPAVSTDQTTGGYITVQDDSGAIQMSIPAEWAQVDGQKWVDGDLVLGASITAAADVDAFISEYYEPGVFFGASDQIAKLGGYVQLLDVYRETYRKDCELVGRYDYSDSAFEGKYDLYTNCLSQANTMVVLSARPINNPTSMLITVLVNMMTDADFEALDEVLATFDVVGSLP
jgi:serine protease Do